MKQKKLLTLLGAICLVVILAALPLMAACAKPAPPPAREVFIFKYSHIGPKTSGYDVVQDWFLDEVEKRSEQWVQFERYYTNSLVPASEILNALNSGAADAGMVVGSYVPGQAPLLTLGLMPAMFEDLYEGMMAEHYLYKEVPAMNEELARYGSRYLSSAGGSAYKLLTREPVNSLDDIKGMKIRVLGPGSTLIKALGGVPVETVSAEIYEALEKGTIDGALLNPTFVAGFNLQDAAKYWYDVSFGAVFTLMAISQKAWDSVGADIQKVMEEVAEEHPSVWQEKYQMEFDGKALDTMRAAGVKTTPGTPEANARVVELSRTMIWDSWVKDMEEKGLPGRQVLDTYLSLVEKYKAQSPYKK